MSKYAEEEGYDVKLGSVLYFKDDLDTKVYLYDILKTVYSKPNNKYLYYMVDDERPYKRSSFLTKVERRKIIINKFLNKNK